MIARYIQSNYSSLKYHISLFSELYSKKSLKMPKGSSEAVNAMVNRQRANDKHYSRNNLQRKPKIEQHEHN
jgi:hypothetical protein